MKYLTTKHLIAAVTACAMATAWAAGTHATNGSSSSEEGSTTNMPLPPGAGDPAQVKFNILDANHDGYLTKHEASASPELQKAWKHADTNHDGKVDKSEYALFETGAGSSSKSTSQSGTSGAGS